MLKQTTVKGSKCRIEYKMYQNDGIDFESEWHIHRLGKDDKLLGYYIIPIGVANALYDRMKETVRL